MGSHRTRAAIAAIVCILCTAVTTLFVAGVSLQQSRATNVDSFLNREFISDASLRENTIDHRAIDWGALKAINPDIIGWITIEGTAVSCPIAKASPDNPDYYLTHDLYREENRYGCPYLDAACESDFSSLHCVIYGHNMGWDDVLFADLQRFTEPDFAAQHQTAYVLTPEKTIALRLFAVSTINGNETLRRVAFASRDDFDSYCESLFSTGTRIVDSEGANDESWGPNRTQLFTLCTCTYFFNPSNERTLVFAYPLTETP